MTSRSPVSSAERIATLDILRGAALFIVLLINAVTEFRVSIFEQLLPSTASSLTNVIVFALHTKGIILFSFLFGVGLAIQFDRLADDERRSRLLLRRLAALLLFGLVHLYLIWNGDILTQYAVAGLLVLPLLHASRPALLLAAIALLLWFGVSALFPPVPYPDNQWITQHLAEARQVYAHGSYFEIMAFRIGEVRSFSPFHAQIFPRTLALIVLGAWTWRRGFFRRAELPGTVRRTAWIALPTGAVLLFVSQFMSVFDRQTTQLLHELSDFSLAFGYGVAIMTAATAPWGTRAIGWIAAFGQMAFSNYIAQSIVLGLIFYGYGLGLYGIAVWPTIAIVFAVFAAQVLFSRWWLDRFLFGPLEWLWRSLMYGERQPMLRR